MFASSRRWLFLSSCLAAAHGACLIYNEDLLESESGSGGEGGIVNPACTTPAECPGMDSTCQTRTCDDATCGVAFTSEGTTCTESGGKVCDGAGTCVACTLPEHCDAGEVCTNHSCVDEGSLMNGEPCSQPAACMSMQCVDGVCCADACSGLCRACDVANNLGTCTNIPDGQDPDNECAESCNGSAMCAGCGDMMEQGSEECDDGNTNPFDNCSATCLDPTTHLLITEFVVQPTTAEFVEIYNPTNAAISLTTVYIADYNTYYTVTTGGVAPSADFNAHFPNGATIGAKAFVVVALDPAASFMTEYGVAPDYDLTQMVGSISSTAGLTNTDEMIVLYQWDGVATTVTDIDYVVYGNTSDAMDKSAVSGYQNDTPGASQVPGVAPDTDGRSLHRCDTAEASETKTGGNGTSNHDETSESGTAAFKEATMRSPAAAPALGFCP